ncbi:MAG: hypothetical protein ACHQRJ_04585 [Alphaproteobacteria bacterium]
MAAQGGEEGAARLAEIDAAMRRGDLIVACDLAHRAVEEFPDVLAYKHRALLAMARAGATARALDLYGKWALGEAATEDAKLAVDLPSLQARLLKDVASPTPRAGATSGWRPPALPTPRSSR